VERVILPDATTVLHYALDRMARILDDLVVYPDAMRRNLDRTFGLYNSQRLLNALIDRGLAREVAYDLVQPRAMQAWEEGRSFLEIVLASPELTEHLSESEIRDVFDPEFHLRRVDEIFGRVGLD
jgi:adenylosuccinate lyase